jgi:hypothetical protein
MDMHDFDFLGKSNFIRNKQQDVKSDDNSVICMILNSILERKVSAYTLMFLQKCLSLSGTVFHALPTHVV